MAKTERPSDMLRMAGLRLKAARLALDVDRQVAMASALNAGYKAYNSWEDGTRLPDVGTMVRLLRLTGIGPDWIYGGLLRGVPFDLASKLQEKAAEVGAVVGGPVAEWPMQAERRHGIESLKPPARAPKPRSPRHTLHDRIREPSR